MSELKRCECGGQPVLLHRKRIGMWVECEECEETTKACQTINEAVDEWNASREGDAEPKRDIFGYLPTDYDKYGMPYGVDQWNVIDR